MTQDLKSEWQYKFLKAGTEYGFGDLSAMINVVSELLSEQRLAVLSEVEREVVKKQYYSDDGQQYVTSIEDISTIISNLRVK